MWYQQGQILHAYCSRLFLEAYVKLVMFKFLGYQNPNLISIFQNLHYQFNTLQ